MVVHRVIRANIISWDSGGLGTDVGVLSQALARAGCEVWYKGHRHRKPHNRIHSLMLTAGVIIEQCWVKLTGRPRFDINFFIESVFSEYLPMARVNTLFVNPEWFRDEIYEHLQRIDFLLCKTSDGFETLSDLPVALRNIGFSSPDKRIEGFVRSNGPIRCLHLAGQSALKGTESVIDAWSHHPEWPHLTVVRRSKRYGGEEAPSLHSLPNVKYETDYLTDEQLRQLQNECEVHVIPSLAEGYGHVIGEAMSCGAVVVTTDAPPMNELIGLDRGMLIRVERTEKKYRSMLNNIDVADLEVKLNMVFAMSHEQRSELGRKARAWYVAQHARFDKALQKFLWEQLRQDVGNN